MFCFNEGLLDCIRISVWANKIWGYDWFRTIVDVIGFAIVAGILIVLLFMCFFRKETGCQKGRGLEN